MTSKAFKEMDPEVIQKLLEGHENVIAPEIFKEQNFLNSRPCPVCHQFNADARVNPKNPFVRGQILSNKILHCANCQTEFDPHTGIIIATKLLTDESD